MDRERILISGAGIAGLTLAIALKRNGFDPLVIEREPALRSEGYMMDFFGTGWDVAERLGLVDRLRDVRYPIDSLEFVRVDGTPYVHVPIDRVRRALDNKYVYIRRQDLERILAEQASEAGVAIRYGLSLQELDDRGDTVHARFDDGSADRFALVVGADGVHSQVRSLVFGPERRFSRFLGLYAAAFHYARRDLPMKRTATVYEETDRMAIVYPLDSERLDATFVIRHGELSSGNDEPAAFLRAQLQGAGWIIDDVLRARDERQRLFFDSVTQIVMPRWHQGRIALIGDACGCLTLIAGQGSHMAMAGGYVLAQLLAREADHAKAFAAYESFLKPHVDKKQRDAERFARIFLPTKRSYPWLRRLTIRLMFSKPLIGVSQAIFGGRSVLPRGL